VRAVLYTNRALLYSAFSYYAAISACAAAATAIASMAHGGPPGVEMTAALAKAMGGEDHQRIRFPAFQQLCKDITGDGCTSEMVEAAFVWATREQARDLT
jgi:hypothetical protein